MRVDRLFVLLLLLTGCSSAGAAKPQLSTPAAPSVVQEVEAMLTHTADAYARGDYERIMQHFHPSENTTLVIYAPGDGTDAHGGRHHVLRGIAAIRQFYADAPMFKEGFERPKLAYRDLVVSQLAPNLVNAIASITMEGGDSRVPRHAMASLVLYKDQGQWRVMHDHTQ